MKESEAKKKMCPKLLAAFISAGRAHQKDLINMTSCKGSACMMWEAEQVSESVKKEVEKENNYALYRKHDYDSFKFSRCFAEQGEGRPKVEGNMIIELTRYVDSDSGDCGLKTKELYCEGCSQ